MCEDEEGTIQAQADHRREAVQAKLALKGELMRRRHLPIPEQGRWLASVLRGHYHYYARARQHPGVVRFRDPAVGTGIKALRRRSQRDRVTWKRMRRLAQRMATTSPQIIHPWPDARFDARTQGRSPVR